MAKRCQDCNGCIHAREQISNSHTNFLRTAANIVALTSDTHQAANTLHGVVITRTFAVRACLAKARHAAIHQARVDFEDSTLPDFAEGNFVMNEQTIIQKEARSIKPDRMVVTPDNEVFLLDYKTGASNPKYKMQLENYQKAIEDMGYKVIQKALVYLTKEVKVEFYN
jgi:ATP-dependent exoDNAse (exonuclease V) beta subunit